MGIALAHKVPDGFHLHAHHLAVRRLLVVGVVNNAQAPLGDVFKIDVTSTFIIGLAKQVAQIALVTAAGVYIEARLLGPGVVFIMAILLALFVGT